MTLAPPQPTPRQGRPVGRRPARRVTDRRSPGPRIPEMGVTRRAVQLLLGLAGYAASMAMVVQAGQGAMPWDVLHQGVVRATGWSFGVAVLVASILVLAAWVPLRQRPGIGTVANVVVISALIGPALVVVDRLAPEPGRAAQVLLVVGGIVLNGVATAAYVGVRLGPGPRDGLLTGLVARTGWSVRAVKTGIEVAVVVVGVLLGGTFGWATIAYALGVGPVVQAAARWRPLVPAGLTTPAPRRARGRRRAPEPALPAAHPDQVRRRAARIARALASFGDQHR
ncbi:YitT family protein [Isoptericola sp. 178]|uniref:membrane protein YczE n=1 Tax=Isoptericola sp. 178 TaxID=3064651 RepID=UPI003518D5CD